jgi:CspA family cold shock protein
VVIAKNPVSPWRVRFPSRAAGGDNGRRHAATLAPANLVIVGVSSGKQMKQGTVKFFNVDRGFGFISRDDGDDDVFIHIRALHEAGIYSVIEGDRLEFELRSSLSKRGREEACDIKKIGSRCVGDPR